MTSIAAPAATLAEYPSARHFFLHIICGTEWGSGRALEKVSQAGNKGKGPSTETSPSFPRSSLSPSVRCHQHHPSGLAPPSAPREHGGRGRDNPPEGQMPELVGLGKGSSPPDTHWAIL